MSDELKTADALLDQADALLHRHRGVASLMTASGDDLAADDLPLLTEVVHEQLPEAASAESPGASTPKPDIERLAALDALIAREVEAWLANELPQLLSTELDRLAERLRSQALARAHATLLPALSERILGARNPGDAD